MLATRLRRVGCCRWFGARLTSDVAHLVALRQTHGPESKGDVKHMEECVVMGSRKPNSLINAWLACTVISLYQLWR